MADIVVWMEFVQESAGLRDGGMDVHVEKYLPQIENSHSQVSVKQSTVLRNRYKPIPRNETETKREWQGTGK